jgi:alpha-1,3-rhamnosyl/mannosyltransferase
VRELHLDVLHIPLPIAPRGSAAPMVITSHDALPWDRPEFYPRRLVLYSRMGSGPALRRAKVVITPSRYSGERMVAAVGVERHRIAVVPHGVDAQFSPGPIPSGLLERLGVDRPYLLGIGLRERRKNFAGALAVLERLMAAGFDHTLVIVGGPRVGEERELAGLASSPLGKRVALVGEVSDAELVGLYRGADCLLHLSKGEGFGLPLLEAMACATPVVAASVDSVPEVVGDGGVLCSPGDVDGTVRAIAEVLRSDRRRQELEAAGLAHASRFTWERCAELTVAAYERARGPAPNF